MTQTQVAGHPVVTDERVEHVAPLRRLLVRPESGSLLGALVIFAFFFVMATAFRKPESLANILYFSSTIGIMAVGVALLMIGGEFDLSAGVGVTTAALTAAMVSYELTLNVWAGAALSLALALGIGFLNGYLVVKTGIPSFLITLGTFLMLQGLNLALTKAVTGQVATDDISDMDGFASAKAVFDADIPVGGGLTVKITVLWWLVAVVFATWLLMRTRVGNWIFAAGGNPDSARAVGVPVARVKIGLFMGVGFLAWFTGMHLLFRLNTVQSGEGVGNEFLYIIAAVIGGVLLTGGYGTAIGSAIGALIFGMTYTGINLAGWDADWFRFFLGIMLLLATVMNAWVRNYAARR
jgi:simple sugar transport system permease protein